MTANNNSKVSCTVSRYTVPCSICSSDILPGDRMFAMQPIAKKQIDTDDDNVAADKNKKRAAIVWGHEACYNPSLPPPPTCRHWQRLGRCPAQDMGMCAFRHDEKYKGISKSLDKQRWGGRRHFVRNQHKNSVFRIWLMQTYGMDYLNRTDGVILDVAGGKGELSFELINLCGIKGSTVIDPRPLNLRLVQTKWSKGLWEPQRTGVFSKWNPACEVGCKDRQSTSPRHMRCFFDSESIVQLMNAKDDIDIERTNQQFASDLDRAKRIVWTTKGLQHEDGVSYNEEEKGETKSTANSTIGESGEFEIVDPSEARNILKRCHLIVGFHPDQAAGEIVDFAISENIPWCIVPCCVYSDTFTKRKLKDGSKVKTYDNLVQWLLEKDPRAKVDTLELEGKNQVVYMLPE